MARRVLEMAIDGDGLEVQFPEIEILEKFGKPIGTNRIQALEHHILLDRRGRSAVEFQEWITNILDNTVRYRLYGCYEWEEFQYRIERNFIGFSIYFPEMSDVLKFNLGWSENCRPC